MIGVYSCQPLQEGDLPTKRQQTSHPRLPLQRVQKVHLECQMQRGRPQLGGFLPVPVLTAEGGHSTSKEVPRAELHRRPSGPTRNRIKRQEYPTQPCDLRRYMMISLPPSSLLS